MTLKERNSEAPHPNSLPRFQVKASPCLTFPPCREHQCQAGLRHSMKCCRGPSSRPTKNRKAPPPRSRPCPRPTPRIPCIRRTARRRWWDLTDRRQEAARQDPACSRMRPLRDRAGDTAAPFRKCSLRQAPCNRVQPACTITDPCLPCHGYHPPIPPTCRITSTLTTATAGSTWEVSTAAAASSTNRRRLDRRSNGPPATTRDRTAPTSSSFTSPTTSATSTCTTSSHRSEIC
mmetsp:Transcript_16472/g.45999  ORF Transcript_16472/g.45999 Transcript_16472/m.45999 type:complete len:233 (-) Transcript_16472:110-808(-)